MEPLTLEEFENRTEGKCKLPTLGKLQGIVGLRDLSKIEHIMAMPVYYLEGLMRSVTLVGEPDVKPYADSKISVRRMDPEGMRVCQTFVERRKLLGFLENFCYSFNGHHVSRGVAKLMPFIAFGRTRDDTPAMAHYLPPIVELRDGRILMDGTHRNMLTMRSGTTIETIHVYNVTAPLPCEPVRWDVVKHVDEKPPKEERFLQFNQKYFRDLKGLGVDA